MKGFYDIEGTEICEGDEILYSAIPWAISASELTKGIVSEIKGNKLTVDILPGQKRHTRSTSLLDYGCSERVFILKGEFKTYSKKELKK